MSRFVFVCAFMLTASCGIAWTQDTKADKRSRTYSKVEIRGILKVSGSSGKVEKLESSSATVVADREGQLTGVTIQTDELGALDVYLGDDKNLNDLAKKLNGKLVVVTGKLGVVTIYPRYRGGSAILLQTNKGPFLFAGELPATRPFIRAVELYTPKD